MAAVPTGTIEDHHGMGISGDLAADLAEMVVHGGGIAGWHDQRRRFARRRAHRTKQIGRGKAEVPSAPPAGCRFAPTPGSDCSSGRCEPRPYMRVRLSTTFLRSVLRTWVGEEQRSPWGPGRFASQHRRLRNLTCGRVLQGARTIMPHARGVAPVRRDPPETRWL